MYEKCNECGDFGYTNIWGVPFLKFVVYCILPKGHEGKHEGLEDMKITSTNEPNGLKVNPKSIEVTPQISVKWENK